MRVSLVTVTYNRAEQLKKGITTVLNQAILPDELVIIDDGSTDNTKEVCEAIKKVCADKNIDFVYTWINHPEPRISCIPRNVGIKEASGDIIIFTESEALHVGNTIEQLLAKYNDNPNCVPLATQVWSMGRRIWEKLSDEEFATPARIISHPYAQLVNGNMQNTNAPDADFGITGSLDCYVGILFLVTKEDLLTIRGFDESFEGHGWDDWDLLHRLETLGREVIKCNDIAVIHQWHEKNYPYNIYDAAEKNGKISEARTKKKEFRANIGRRWGKA